MSDEEEFDFEDDVLMAELLKVYCEDFEKEIAKYKELQQTLDEAQHKQLTKIALVRNAIRDGVPVEDVAQIALRSNVPAQYLKLSIDERVVAERIELMKQLIESLRSMVRDLEAHDPTGQEPGPNTTQNEGASHESE
jgi:EAL domain-containing protein (putative c-di-GMP-specific phosphodiesterase class I)